MRGESTIWSGRIRLNPEGVAPLYHQLKEQVRLEASRLEPGKLIPSEKDLMQFASVGRATVRRAIADLVQEGILCTYQGRGTFTSPRRIETALERPAGFTETMRRLGRNPHTRLIIVESVAAPPEIAEKLGLEPGDGVYVVERLRLIDDEPCMIERTHLAERLLPGLLKHDLTGSLYDVIATEYGLRPASGTETIVAVNADRHLAQLLGIPIASALLATVRRTETDLKIPLEYTLRHARGDLLSFRVALAAGSSISDMAPVDRLLLPVDR